MSKRQRTVALLGCGGISKSHRAAFDQIDSLRVGAVVDLDEARAREAQAACGAQWAFTDWREAVALPEVEVVDICLPHTLHRDPAVAAAKAGKHVFTEKPMATTLADVDAMIEAADEAGVTLAVGQVLRFRESTVRARQLLKEGAVGEPLNHIRRRQSYSPKYASHPWATDFSLAGGWVLYGFGTHEMDALLWIADSPAKKLWAQGRKLIPEHDDVDEITVLLELESGAMATLILGQNVHQGGWEEWIAGTAGSLHVTTDAVSLNGQAETGLDYQSAMLLQWQEFVGALDEGREPSHSGHSVRPCMAALEAARRSMATGEVIDVSAL